VDEWSLVEKKIPSFDIVFAVVKDPSAAGQEVEFTAHQKKILPLVDGEHTVEDIVTESGLVEFEVGKALFGLIQAGFVDKLGKKAADDAEKGGDAVKQRINLGIAFYNSGLMEDAVREFQEALKADPKNARARYRLGLIAFRSGRLEQALEHFSSMPAESQASYSVLRNRALILELMGKYNEAIDALQQAQGVRPGDPDLALARGIAHLLNGQVDESLAALGDYRTSSSVKKPSAVYYAYTVLAAAMAGDLDYAVQVGREGLGHHPNNGPLLVNSGAVLERKGEIEAAMGYYARAVSEGNAPAQAHKNLGDAAYAKGDMAAARVHYEKAVKIDSNLGDDVYLRLGTIAYKDNDVDVAKLLWARALQINPGNEHVRSNLEILEG
jgi:tetratricopeptide (TPR) repeat protein